MDKDNPEDSGVEKKDERRRLSKVSRRKASNMVGRGRFRKIANPCHVCFNYNNV
jgi:hypothetical protein